jgi:hypothetical protein
VLAIIGGIVAAVVVIVVVIVATSGGKKSSNTPPLAADTSSQVPQEQVTKQSVEPPTTSAPEVVATAEPPTTASATAPPKPTLPSTQANIDLARVASSPHLAKVAKVLDTYFIGINEHDGQKAASVFAANGSVNPNDPAQVEHFAQGISTTQDDKISVVSIKSASFNGQTGLAVRVHFRSQQDASLGPNNEACTNWTLTQKLVAAGSSYKLLGAQDVVSAAC